MSTRTHMTTHDTAQRLSPSTNMPERMSNRRPRQIISGGRCSLHRLILMMTLLSASVLGSMQQCAVFYDNNSDSFKNDRLLPLVQPIPVKDSGSSTTTTDMRAVRDFYKDQYTDKEQQIAEALSMLKEPIMIDVNSGITIPQIDALMAEVRGDSNIIYTIVFDFDRTLTCVEGLPYDASGSERNNTKDILDMLSMVFKVKKENEECIFNRTETQLLSNVLFGGMNRVTKLRELWELLNEKRIGIWILTNNKCLTKEHSKYGRPYFHELLENAGLRVPDENILYNTTGDKYTTLAAQPHFNFWYGNATDTAVQFGIYDREKMMEQFREQWELRKPRMEKRQKIGEKCQSLRKRLTAMDNISLDYGPLEKKMRKADLELSKLFVGSKKNETEEFKRMRENAKSFANAGTGSIYAAWESWMWARTKPEVERDDESHERKLEKNTSLTMSL